MYNYKFKIIPPHFDDYLKFLVSKNNHSFEASLKTQRKIFVFLCADYGNIGDLCISLAQTEFLEKHFPQYTIIPHLLSSIYTDMKCIKSILHKDDIITIIGGGNNGSLYPGIEFSRLFIIKNFPHNKIISFPQSFHISDDWVGKKTLKKMIKVYSQHKNLHLVAREQVSYEKYCLYFNTPTLVTPDIVFSYSPSLPQYIRGNHILLCLRNDSENYMPMKYSQNLIDKLKQKYELQYTDTVLNKTYKNFNNTISDIQNMLGNFCNAKLVITDRLHGMIFSYITQTPCIVFPCSTSKIASSYEWIKDCNYIHFCPKLIPIDEIMDIISYLSTENQCQKLDLSNKFLPLINIIKN